MDVFLGYICSFCVSTNTGFDSLPMIFRKPILYIGSMPVGIFTSNSKKIMVTTKKHYSKKNKKILTLHEIFEQNLAYSLIGEDFTNKRIKLLDLSPQEINQSTIDMINYIDNNFKLSKKNERINQLFWKKYENLYLKYLPKNKIHGKIRCIISPSFLKKYRSWLLNG